MQIPPHPIWADPLRDLRRSLYAEQIFCSLTSEMRAFPAFAEQPALDELHKENYETSYHRNTACGHLTRLYFAPPAAVEEFDRLTVMAIACVYNSRKHDKLAQAQFEALVASDPVDQAWLQLAMCWHLERKRWLKVAAADVRALVSPDLWAQGKAIVVPA